jgi:hypothetical protein
MDRRFLRIYLLVPLILYGCGNDARDNGHRGETTLPPIFPKAPAVSTNWESAAGSILVISVGSSDDSAEIVLPDVSDSTIAALGSASPSVSGMKLDLFGRSGKLDSNVPLTQLSAVDTTEECYTWPAARLAAAPSGWRVGFASGHVTAVPLDSIEAMKSVDSAALAAVLTQSAATLPATSDPVFRGLPFRIRSAYRLSFDSVEAVIADVIRSVNEEANPRLEHLLLIGERPVGSSEKYSVVYYNRTAGAEESTQVTEVLAVVRTAASSYPIAVLNVEYNDGGRYALLERTSSREWKLTWRSAYTGC